MVLIGNDNADFGIAQHFIPNTENRFKSLGRGNLKMLKAMLLQMRGDRTLCRQNRIGLCLDSGRHTACMTSPVIHKSGHMHDGFGIVRQAQNHVMVLAPIKLCAK